VRDPLIRMLLQTNSYIVPKEKRAEHARLVRRFRQTLARLGCEHFEVYEQVGANWGGGESTGRYVHIMRFRDRKHQLAVQAAERNDKAAQALITEFCELINFPYQQQQGLFAVGFYQSVLPVTTPRITSAPHGDAPGETAPEADAAHGDEHDDAHRDAPGDDVSAEGGSSAPAADDHAGAGGGDGSSGEHSKPQKA
jgi:hypothetical protein